MKKLIKWLGAALELNFFFFLSDVYPVKKENVKNIDIYRDKISQCCGLNNNLSDKKFNRQCFKNNISINFNVFTTFLFLREMNNQGLIPKQEQPHRPNILLRPGFKETLRSALPLFSISLQII